MILKVLAPSRRQRNIHGGGGGRSLKIKPPPPPYRGRPGRQHRAASTPLPPPAPSSTGWPSTANRRKSPSAPLHRPLRPRAAPPTDGTSRPLPLPPPPTSGRTEHRKTFEDQDSPLPHSADRPRSTKTIIARARRASARTRPGPPRAGATRAQPPLPPPTSASGREGYRTTPRNQRAPPMHLASRPHPPMAQIATAWSSADQPRSDPRS